MTGLNLSSITYPPILCIFLFSFTIIYAFPDEGRWDLILDNENAYGAVSKSLFKGSQIFLQITCGAHLPNTKIKVQWVLSETPCWEEYLIFMDGVIATEMPVLNDNRTLHFESEITEGDCNGHLILNEFSPAITEKLKSISTNEKTSDTQGSESGVSSFQSALPVETTVVKENVKFQRNPSKLASPDPVYTIPKDGMYLLQVHIFPENKFYLFTANVTVEMQGHYGYLSAAAWPLLPFYGAMCIIYVFYGVAWLIVSFCQWRDLLRIQFWIGGVILLGMLEKAVFYAQYQSINSTGMSVKGLMLFAEFVSCAKRTLARMLVVIVSLGFGIVKPRLGPMLHRVVGTGILYFLLAAVESHKRITSQTNDTTNQILLASVPLALLDSAFCWWIFANLVQTMRTLRLRRNLVKLSLYRHFSNTLYFSVIASVIFMLYSIKFHRLANCLTDWKELWVDEAYWHILFSVLLLVIMILWRPTNNNQRYAFTPLLDNPEDEDEEEEQFNVSDAFGLTMRGNNRAASPKPKSSTSVDDDLKWVEENIPASLSDTALPVLDSDEEIMSTKFEVSKMQ